MRHVVLALLTLFGILTGCGGAKKSDFRSYGIGRDQSWYPLHLDQYAPKINNFTNALVQEIAKSEKTPLHIINISWIQLFEFLDKGEIGGAFTPLSPNAITQEKYSFSDPFLLLGPVLVVPSDSKATSLEDLSGQIVAVNQFDESILIVQKYPSVIIRTYQNIPTALDEVAAGQFDAALIPNLDARSLIPQLYERELKIVSKPLNNKALRLITLKGKNEALITDFNNGLKKAHELSDYSSLRIEFQLP